MQGVVEALDILEGVDVEVVLEEIDELGGEGSVDDVVQGVLGTFVLRIIDELGVYDVFEVVEGVVDEE